ncbi:MAG: hypothetical protein A2Y62_04895 [Candidatus Fischerbacteria bacterium RBG_13_37_8]|uniref:Transcriptional repressor n=1 Tax=Candidatus Fischerbacteria bacterium RBG_13_37_8 TaxID=1817863 RepID=A0A1F5VJ53_9BACT|nr:MAG: hypothetical protein A2Y62_04895 [Candidatus Fischerbacteria bacterium RBG_13_37_8]
MQYFMAKLKLHNLKFTPRRIAIIQLFLSNNIFTPEEIWNRLKKQFKKCGLPGVYRNLESLVECGILAKIHKIDRKRYYGLCSAKENIHHHHIICLQCGKVDDISDCFFEKKETIKGYKLISHYIQLNGICEGCLNK